MTYRALVVDDELEILGVVGDVLDSLGHEYDTATCQDEARRLLAEHQYSYHLLDLEIPVRPNRGFPRIQNGENLLRQIAARRNGRHEPILVMTGHGTDSPKLAVQMMKLGAADYITRPFATVGRTLDQAILDALAQQPHTVGPATPSEASPFRGGELVFYSDRIELCGVKVVCGDSRIRKILEHLKERRSNGKYVAYSGVKLAHAMGLRGGQNGIAEAIKDFRDEVEDALKARGIICGRKDVIQSGGAGYRLAKWIVAHVVGE
jgi:DNA-binding response OmpR family regulator